MPTHRFPIGDGREVVLTRRSGRYDVRVDAEYLGEATGAELRKCVLFHDARGAEIHVVALQSTPFFALFDVYYAGRLLPGSAGDPFWARRNVIDILILMAVYDLGSVIQLILHARWPADWMGWSQLGSLTAALTIAFLVFLRVPAAAKAARTFMFIRCALAVFSFDRGMSISVDLGAIALYAWMMHATRTVAAMDEPPIANALRTPAQPQPLV